MNTMKSGTWTWFQNVSGYKRELRGKKMQEIKRSIVAIEWSAVLELKNITKPMKILEFSRNAKQNRDLLDCTTILRSYLRSVMDCCSSAEMGLVGDSAACITAMRGGLTRRRRRRRRCRAASARPAARPCLRRPRRRHYLHGSFVFDSLPYALFVNCARRVVFISISPTVFASLT